MRQWENSHYIIILCSVVANVCLHRYVLIILPFYGTASAI